LIGATAFRVEGLDPCDYFLTILRVSKLISLTLDFNNVRLWLRKKSARHFSRDFEERQSST
jgi:hypothetical protein